MPPSVFSGRSTRWGMLQDLSRLGVTIEANTKALEITDAGVKVEREGGVEEGVEEILADTIVLAGGAKSVNPLQEALEAKGISCRVAGDAGQVATAFEAVHAGFRAGREI